MAIWGPLRESEPLSASAIYWDPLEVRTVTTEAMKTLEETAERSQLSFPYSAGGTAPQFGSVEELV